MEIFVARQPIFDRQKRVYAYELLYRKANIASANITDFDNATSEVVTNSMLLIGIESLTGGKKAFINFTRNLLENEFAVVFPPNLVAVEILETIEPDEIIINACKKLKQMGYTLVLDDFVYSEKFDPLVKIADIIKIDFLNTPMNYRRLIVEKFKKNNIKFVAEKVETQEDFQQAVDMGYDFFQGYFFSKPVVVSGRDMPSSKIGYLRLISEVNKQVPDFDEIEDIIRRDLSLAFKLLKYINSASYGFKSNIKSIKHALVLLGVSEIKKWVSLVALKSFSEDKPDEIMRSSTVRARFGELLTEKMGLENLKSDIFMMGLFSMIDTLTGMPLDLILSDLPLPSEVKDAILGKQGTLYNIFNIILAYEKGDWVTFYYLAEKYDLDLAEIPNLFVQTLNWTDQLFTENLH